MRKYLFLLTIILVSCVTNQKPLPQGVLVETRDFSQPVENNVEEQLNLQQILIEVDSDYQPFYWLVEDIISLESPNVELVKNAKTITTKIDPEKVNLFVENIESRLDRYGDIKTDANRIVVRPRKLPKYNYTLLQFTNSPSEQDFTKVLSLCRRNKWRIISEWELEKGAAIAIWSKNKTKAIAKAIKKPLPQWSVAIEKHKIVLLAKGTTILFKIDDRSLWREIKLSLTTRFNDMDIDYRDSNNTMNILSRNWQGSITKLIKKILKEDELHHIIKLSLDKNTKTITITKK
ncbi:hypothetical protein [Candidatus Uabimicrobium amorphum]|uniref:Uncharacterized protein n=1 Tax=Uabimicrobium amorphum TaxID=2596890 RepID=A0A5S9F5U3_UABAM|nr:hypothetical protein [Candidatus Uabimicrobium amorphum]BBM85632.1 hypothetical protein UABAM_04006 [Candidatus Uabimicrobium amorphum]